MFLSFFKLTAYVKLIKKSVLNIENIEKVNLLGNHFNY